MAEVMLPYRTDWRAMGTLLDYAKGKGVDRATLEARMGAGESLRETLNAAEQLGLVTRDEVGDVRLTPQGERLAYASSESERRDELARAMLSYPPYAIPLERAVAEELTVLDAPWVERVWQVDMRLGQPRNRVEEARTFFFRLADEAGLGTYRRGVRGQPTRLDLAPDVAARLASLRQQSPETAEPAPAAAVPTSPGAGSITLPTDGLPSRPGVTLSVTVDMTDWDIDKITAFLRLVGLARE
ncbi:hypothetical protein [Sphaerobacter thermophilus]|uniref:Uncharacterized protein n=1 Tax=Sphaerobacter thermophilus (strain ATCC 49802 / DSM 20745 / KCCM 41009 / NCIMB 13125 / S 6022) TaxID=479434 RepID=D1C9L1_SPHTD|nr:hypothetical protein [Sphaerobacter thermophilus]ACZ40504.1 hypothetical protein Sthe_3104 [Sphaerobacter thermophilus DSM 20745]